MRTRNQDIARRAAGLLLASVLAATGVTSAGAASFRPASYGTEKKVFCELTEIKGTFSQTDARYVSGGVCVQLEAKLPGPTEGVKGESLFTDYRDAKELFRAAWTAEAGYDQTSRVAWETITLPAPRTDEPSAVGRPYGRVLSKRVCETDPWLVFGNPKCSGGTVETTGSLGDAAKRLSTTAGPFTKPYKEKYTQALVDAHEQYLKHYARVVKPTLAPGKATPVLFTLPEIVLPQAGSTQRPQTPMRVRVAAPKNDKVQSYLLQFEIKQQNGEWATATNVPVSAAEAEGPLGYNGWGWHRPGTGPAMTAVPGAYRIRAQATAPTKGEPGAWREFTVAGQPGPAPDEFQVNKASSVGASVRAAAAPKAPAALTAATASTSPAAPTTPMHRATTALGVSNRDGAAPDWSKAAPGTSPSTQK
jgi:hypothetical protein